MAKILDGPCATLSGVVDVPASKSLTNRALIAAAAAGGGIVGNPLDCEDTRLLADALAGAGWLLDWEEEIRVGPRERPTEPVTVHLGNSGTGARLLIGLLAATPGRYVVDGTARLRERPMGPLVDALRSLGAVIECDGGCLPISIEGSLMKGGSVEIRPQVSSQFVSSLMLAGTLMSGGLELRVAGEVPSRPYLDLTIDMMASFGIAVMHAPESTTFRIPARTARPTAVSIEGDWSAAAFMAAAASVAGGRVEVGPLHGSSRQGDRVVCDILQSAGVGVAGGGDRIVFHGPVRQPFQADLRDSPDLFPALAVVAACAPVGSRLTGLDHLRHKESDRFSVMVENLERLGCEFHVGENSCDVLRGLTPTGPPMPDVTAADDHRIAMAMAVAALVAGPIRLDNPDCVAKSFPGFWRVWEALLAQTGEGNHHP